MRLRDRVQGFTIGAAVMGAFMLGLPALTAPNSPHTDMDELAAQFDVEIVWSNVTPCTLAGLDGRGCYFYPTPSRIYVSPDLASEDLRHTVLHEIGHVIQGRLALPLDDCAADRLAQSLGSTIGYHCRRD